MHMLTCVWVYIWNYFEENTKLRSYDKTKKSLFLFSWFLLSKKKDKARKQTEGLLSNKLSILK